MCSDAKLTANRLNAQKSTGPRSDQGKQKSSQNSLKHGLTAGNGTVISACSNLTSVGIQLNTG